MLESLSVWLFLFSFFSETISNICLVCIFATTLMTLGSWRGSIFVMMCVLFTCIDVAGFMHWWGLTIEITSMNILIISVGLCVDFCAHIMHGFLTVHGTREERIMHIMENIAPAVINGGFSSILALSLLVTSRSHIFTSFFKIFFMICVFGLFHGLIMLPVVLCVLGPADPTSEQQSKKEPKTRNDSSHNLAKRFSRDISEKYLQENISNIETEQREMEVMDPSSRLSSISIPPCSEQSTSLSEPSDLPSESSAPPTDSLCESSSTPTVTDSLLRKNSEKDCEDLENS